MKKIVLNATDEAQLRIVQYCQQVNPEEDVSIFIGIMGNSDEEQPILGSDPKDTGPRTKKYELYGYEISISDYAYGKLINNKIILKRDKRNGLPVSYIAFEKNGPTIQKNEPTGQP